MAQQSSCSVIVLAAGAGTRMKSATQKTLHEIGGRSLLSHSVHAAVGLNPDNVVVVVGHQREQVVPAVDTLADELGCKLTTAVQEEQLGTGHAVQCAMAGLEDFQGTVIVTNADVPLLRPETLDHLREHHESAGAGVTVLSVELADATGYGRIVRDDNKQVTAIVEHKDASEKIREITEINSGVFAFDAAILRDALTQLNTDNAQGELYITDVLAIAREAGHGVGAYVAADAGELAGVNNRVQLAEAGKEFNRRTVEAAMLGGATIVDPATTWIGADVTVGQDVTIHPGTQLWGKTSIADGAEIGPDSTLTDVVVGKNARVIRAHAESSRIGAEANVGPFTYLRPGTELGNNAKLGGFVETKKATIGEGSKVPHLTYVGDATIGKHSNIGASSVFVNYDGVNKNHTVVGDHVRTGSDTMFIAPVTVGDGAYSGAGTVIKDDVPPGALAVSGGRQRNIEGWVAQKRPGSPSAQAAQAAENSTADNGEADNRSTDNGSDQGSEQA